MNKIISIALLTVLSLTASAQSSSTQTMQLSTADVIELTFANNNSTKGNNVTLSFKTINDYANGVESADQELKVSSNRDFDVTVKTSASNFTYSGNTTPAPTMPVKDVLSVKVTKNGTGGSVASPFSTSQYSSISSSNQTLISNGDRGGDQTFSVKYKANPGFKYPAGKYTVDVIYTATQR